MRRRGFGSVVSRVVLANLDNGQTLQGVLVDVSTDCLVLDHAQLIDSNGNRTPISGRALLSRARILWVQQPGEADLRAPGDA